MNNANLRAAKRAKNDEFYTRIEDVEKELANYTEHFKGKSVYCNCDTPDSAFWMYFRDRFAELGLKRLTATHISSNTKWEYDGKDLTETKMDGNGDFRSPECVEFLKEADIVVTNPPFSLFREYVAQLVEYGKKFIILGNINAATYKNVFPLIKENTMWIGVNFGRMDFYLPETYERWTEIRDGRKIGRICNACWFTNLSHEKRNTPIDLYRKYNQTDYPKYSNYDAIEVSKVSEIPMDYYETIGVPITFLDKYCPSQFQIVGATESEGTGFSNGVFNGGSVKQALVGGRKVYKRILIRRKSDQRLFM